MRVEQGQAVHHRPLRSLKRALNLWDAPAAIMVVHTRLADRLSVFLSALYGNTLYAHARAMVEEDAMELQRKARAVGTGGGA